MDLPDLKKILHLKRTSFKKWPSWPQWKQLPQVLTKFEKITLIVLVVLVLSSGTYLIYDSYLSYTIPQPAPGGIFVEGVIGQPHFINPIYISSNDVDRDLTQLTFAGLLKYDRNGNLTPDLAQTYNTEQGKIWEVKLKKDIYWQNGEPITADDVIFTVKVIQNSDYRSPHQVNWLGVKTTKISDRKIKFKLESPYPQFAENLTLNPIPKHVWKDVSPENFSLSAYNLKPIGSGPYQIESINKNQDRIISLTLVQNPYYHHQVLIPEITFRFFKNRDQLIQAAKNHTIQGLSLPNSVTTISGFTNYRFSSPRYFAVFFNPDTELLTKPVRKALNYATNNQEIIDQVLNHRAQPVHSPILPQFYNFKPPAQTYPFNLEQANQLLNQQGWTYHNHDYREKVIPPRFQFKRKLRRGSEGTEVKQLQKCLAKDPKLYPEREITGYFGNLTQQAVIRFQEKYKSAILEPWGFESGTGIVGETTRSKLNQVCFKKKTKKLKLSLVVVDQNQMVKVAQLLKQQWQKIGLELKIKKVSLSELKSDFIKPRDYQSLLFGESLRMIPDFFSFWHSSQKVDPGLNLAKFESEQADKLLEQARETMDPELRAKKYQQFQELLVKQAPVVFLYSPDYIYAVSKQVKGISGGSIINPGCRFTTIKDWYLRTKRVWK